MLIDPSRKIVIPQSADHSELFDLVNSGSMPPGTRTKLSEDERQTLRDWIERGAALFPKERGQEYVLHNILKDVLALKKDNKDKLPFVRYFSINHLLVEDEWGQVPEKAYGRPDLDRQRDALEKAINRLSWKSELVKPEADREHQDRFPH